MTAVRGGTHGRGSPESSGGYPDRCKNVTFGALRRPTGASMVPSMENIAPAKRALAALDKPASDATIGRKRISKRVTAAIDAMVTGECKTIRDAAEKVGLARESLSRALSTPHVAEHLRQKVLRYLAISASRAGAVKVDLLDSDNAIARDRASTFILGLAGIQPAAGPALNVNIEVKAGYVIDISEDDRRPMRIVSSTAVPTIDHEPDQAWSED
jgi:hypothetical protein